MFDVSFSEMMVIAIVALIVIGPEKLPKVARTIGALVARIQRYVATVKEEVSRETRFAELQELQEEIKRGVESVRANVVQSVQSIDHEVQQHAGAITQPNSLATAPPSADNKILADKSTTPDLFETAANTQAGVLKSAKKITVRKPRAKKSAESINIKAVEEKAQPLENLTPHEPTT